MIVQPSFRESILTFFRRKFTFLVVFGAVCLAGAGYLLIKTPMYLSSAALVLRFDQQTVPDIDRTRTPPQPLGSNERREILYSDADILRSPDLARAHDRRRSDWRASIQRSQPTTRARSARWTTRSRRSPRHADRCRIAERRDQHLVPESQRRRWRTAVIQTLLDHFFSQEAVIYANPQLQFAEDEAKRAQAKAGGGAKGAEPVPPEPTRFPT